MQELRRGLRRAQPPAPHPPELGELWEMRRVLNSADTGTSDLWGVDFPFSGCGLCVLGQKVPDQGKLLPYLAWLPPFTASPTPLHAEPQKRVTGSEPSSCLGSTSNSPPKSTLRMQAILWQTLDFRLGLLSLLSVSTGSTAVPFCSIPALPRASAQNAPHQQTQS